MFKTDIKTINAVRPIIAQHYGINSPLSNADIRAELLNLNRKHSKGIMDDRQERLHSAITNALKA
jgi:hypothetical protein